MRLGQGMSMQNIIQNEKFIESLNQFKEISMDVHYILY